MKHLRREIIPSAQLSGNTNAYQSGNLIFVSPAVYECLQDPSINEIVMSQVMVKPLSELVESEVNKINDKRILVS